MLKTKRPILVSINFGVALIYFVFAKLGLLMALDHTNVTAIWPPSGFALFTLFYCRYQKPLMGIFLGAFVVNSATFVANGSSLLNSLAPSFMIGIFNLLEACLIYFVLVKYLKVKHPLKDKDGILRLFFVALIGCSLAATMGPMIINWLNHAETKHLSHLIFTWGIGDLTGILVFTPLLLFLFDSTLKLERSLRKEFLLYLLLTTAMAIFIFLPLPLPFSNENLNVYLLLPFFVWAVYRFELAGAISIMFICYATAVTGTIMGSGPFHIKGDTNLSLITMDLFIIIVSLSGIGMAMLYGNLKRTQANLIHSIKLAELGELASGLTHELNNPLHIIKGNLSMIQEQIDDNSLDPESLKKSLGYLNATADRMHKIIQNMGDFSRANEFKKEKVCYLKILEKSLEIFKPQLKHNQINLKLDIPKEEVFIHADASRIEQVIVNLLINAKDSLNTKKTERELSVQLEAKKENVFLRVRDNGAGIDRGDIQNLFTPFFTTKDKGKGTGLGLSISYGIIAEHGGEIFADSKGKGKGAVFTIKMPLFKL